MGAEGDGAVVAPDDEHADDVAVLVDRCGHTDSESAGRELGQRVGGVAIVVDDDESLFAEGSSPDARAGWTSTYRQHLLRGDPGGGDSHKLIGIVQVEEAEADDLDVQQHRGTVGDGVEDVGEGGPARQGALCTGESLEQALPVLQQADQAGVLAAVPALRFERCDLAQVDPQGSRHALDQRQLLREKGLDGPPDDKPLDGRVFDGSGNREDGSDARDIERAYTSVGECAQVVV